MSNRTFFQKPMQWCVILVLSAVLPAWSQDAKKVAKSDAIRNIATRTQPEYPSNARQFHIEGTVELEAVVGTSGAVEKVDIVSGNPMLTRPAANAVRLWKFTPFTEDGKPVRAVAPISIAFKL